MTNLNINNYLILADKYDCENNFSKKNPYREKIAQNLILNIFSKTQPIKGNEEIAVVGDVKPDGKGDWFAMKNLVKKLQKEFPERKIILVATSAQKHLNSLDTEGVDNVEIIFYPEKISTNPKIIQTINNCAFILSGPIGIGYETSDFILDYKKKSVAFTEYDVGTNFDQICARKYMTGLGQESIGIFTFSTKKQYSWMDIQNERLKGILFAEKFPLQEKIENYLSHHEFFLCYVSEPSSIVKFVLEAAAFTQFHGNSKMSDICCPARCHLNAIQAYFENETPESELTIARLKKRGIGSITLIYHEADETKTKIIPIAEKGKELRLIDVGLLSSKDFKILTSISAPLVGCTGDNSVAQVLSFGNIPSMELVGHKHPFSHSIKEHVRAHMGPQSALYKYLNSLNDFDRGPMLADPEIIDQAKTFGTIVRENYSLTQSMKGIINEYFFRLHYPGSADKIKHLSKSFLHKKIDIETLENGIKSELEGKELLSP